MKGNGEITAQHKEISLGEMDDIERPDGKAETKGKEAIYASDGNPADDLLD